MIGNHFPAKVYMRGSGDLVEASVHLVGPNPVVSTATRQLTFPRPDHRMSLEPFGNEIMLDLGETRLIFARELKSDLEKALWPHFDFRRSPVAASLVAIVLFVALAFLVGLAIEFLMPAPIKRMASRNARTMMGVCHDQKLPELEALLAKLGPHPDVIYFSKQPLPNAFALPDKSIVFTRGIIDQMTPESFLGVYGHELRHIELGHTEQLLGRYSMLNQLVENLFGEGGQFIASIMLNQFSQHQEAEADRYGRDFLIKNSIDPRPTGKFFETLGKETGGDTMAFLSTHPSYASRVKFFEEKTVAHSKKYLSAKQWEAIKKTCR